MAPAGTSTASAAAESVSLPSGLEFRRVLGSGVYGVVVLAEDTSVDPPRLVAVKCPRAEVALPDDVGIPLPVLREAAILRSLSGHPNIVSMLRAVPAPASCPSPAAQSPSVVDLCLVLEYLPTDLRSELAALRGLPPAPAMLRRWMRGVIAGVAWAHANRVMHRDIKPANVLLGADGSAKLADFGLARAFHAAAAPPYRRDVVSLWYRAPEILLGDAAYAPAIDLWAVGCVMAECARGGHPLFTGSAEITQLLAIFHLCGTPSPADWPGVQSLPYWSPEFPKWRPRPLASALGSAAAAALGPEGLEVLAALLCVCPANRPAAHQVLQMPYFAGGDGAASVVEPPTPTPPSAASGMGR